MNLFQKMWMEFKLAYFSSQEKLTFNKDVKIRNSDDMIMRGVEATPIESKEEKQIAWFTRQNNLVAEFIEDEPIVYEADMTTVLRENQYGWKEEYDQGRQIKPKIVEEEEVFVDDVSKVFGVHIPEAIESNSTDFLTEKQKFENKWTDIQVKANEEREAEQVKKEEKLKEDQGIIEEEQNKKEW